MSNEKIKCPVCGSDNAKNICIDGTPISKGQYDIEIFPVMCSVVWYIFHHVGLN